MSKKSVLFIHHRYGYGGASKALKFYAQGLSKCGANVGIVFYNSDGSERGAFASEIQLFSSVPSYKNPMLRRLAQVQSTYRAVKEFGAHTVVGLMPVNAMIAVIVGRMAGVKVISSERGNPYAHRGVAENVKRFFMGQADGAIFQTEGARDFYGVKLKSKSAVIPNSVEPSHSQIPFKEKCNQCAFFSRFDLRNKRFDILFDAFSLVQRDIPDMVLNIFGSGSEKEEQVVKRLCLERGILNSVIFHGAVNNSYEHMEKYRYFLLTSDSEGMPNALMEAMACGMVCISTDCDPGGARFLIQDKINGRLVERGDKNAVARSLIDCLGNLEYSQAMSENARLISKTLSKQEIEDKFVPYILSI